MAIFTTVVGCLTLLTSPQTPPLSTAAANGPFAHAGAFSRDTSLLLSWDGAAERAWQRARKKLPPDIVEALPRVMTSLASHAGISKATLDEILQARISIGVSSVARGEPAWLAIAELGDRADVVTEALSRSMGVPMTADASRPSWLTIDGGRRLAVGRAQSALLLGTDENAVADAIRRMTDSADAESLESGIRFRRFLDQCGDDAKTGSVIAAAFCDISGIIERAEEFVPGPQRQAFRSAIDAAGLSQVFAAGYVANEVGGLVHEHTRVCFPEPRTGPLTLLTGTGGLDAEIAKFVPDDTRSFTAFHLDIPAILSAAETAAGAIRTDAKGALRQAVDELSAQLGLDLAKDVLPAFGRRIVTLDWSDSAAIDAGAVIELSNPLVIASMLRKMPMFTSRVVDGFELFEMSGTMDLAVAIGEGNLVVTGSNARLQSVLRQFATGTGPDRIRDLLGSSPRTTTAVASSQVGAFLRQIIFATQRAMPGSSLDLGSTQEMGAVLDSLGTSDCIVTVDPEGLSMRTHSKLGWPGVACITASLAIHRLAPASMRRDDAQHAAFSWRMTRILETARRAGSTDLAILARDHGLGTQEVGSTDPRRGRAIVDGYRLAILGSLDTDFAVVAWPDGAQQGDVFACTSDGVPLVNSLLTQSAGIEEFTLRDLLLDGKFGNSLMTGWQPIIADVATTAPSPETPTEQSVTPDVRAHDPNVVELSGSDWATYQSILATEAGDLDLSPAQLVEFLDADNPVIAVRAAQALAKLDAKDAKGELAIRLASDVENAASRRQMTRTLARLARTETDAATNQCMRLLLEDDDPIVRAIAARFVGSKRDKAATNGLLSILMRESTAADTPDRTVALLSLADIGDERCLKQVMGCPLGSGRQHGEALAYLFQELSSQLEATAEVATLMSVLDHDAPMLRRYAIQRLGELQDDKALGALEKRLATESDELRPLVDVSIAAIRGPVETDNTPAGAASGGGNPVIARAKQWYSMLGKRHKNMVVAGGTGAGMLFVGILFLLLRRPKGSDVDWASMTGPSEPEFDDAFDEGAWDEAAAVDQEGVYHQDEVEGFAEPPFGDDDAMAAPSLGTAVDQFDDTPRR